MMVTVMEDETNLLSRLSSPDNKVDRLASYVSLTECLKEADFVSQVIEEVQLQAAGIIEVFSKDVSGENADVTLAALQVLGFCLHHEDMAQLLVTADGGSILDALCTTVVKTTDKNICTRALWCLATQSASSESVLPKVEQIIAAVEHAMCNKNFQSMTVEHEGLNVIIRLLEQTNTAMMPHTLRWAKLLYPLLVHGAAKVRDRAVVAMEIGMPAILQHQMEVGRCLMSDLKDKEKSLLLGQIGKLMASKQEVYVMKVWSYYITILGKLLHHGTMINQLLPIVEQAFKNSAPEIKCAAYQAWKALIDNFALNPDIVSDHKRVKLVMQVFRVSNTKYESVAMEKFDAWWHFVQNLDQKASLFFDTVCVPLLTYSVGGLGGSKSGMPGSATRTPTISRLGFSPNPATTQGTTSSPAPTFRRLAHAGSEVLGRMLGSPLVDVNLPPAKFKIDELEHEIITGPAFFVKQAPIFLVAVRECFTHLGDDIPDGLLYHIWYALVAHIKNVLDVSSKKDCIEVLPSFISMVQYLVTRQCLQSEKLLKMLQAVSCLPGKALASSAYAVGTTQTGVMQGSPALFLLELLFHHRLLETCATQERFFTLLEKLIGCGLTNQSAALSFCKSVLQLIDQSALKVEKKETMWRMWSAIIHPLQDTIQKTNEVNQGDILEHDFTCLYSALQLPLQHLLSQSFPQQSLKVMMKSWADLYVTFARLAAMVTNAEANVCCEELCGRLLSIVDNNRHKLEDVVFLDGMTQVCGTIIGQVDFSSLSSPGQFGVSAAASPAKTLKKQRPLGNLYSFVRLVIVLAEALQKVAKESVSFFESKKAPSSTALQIPALAIIEVLTMIFTHLPTSGLIALAVEKLAKTIAVFFEESGKKPTNKLYSAQVLQKLEKLWLDIVTCIQGRYQGHYDSEFLAHFSPLLESTFLNQRRPIRNQTNILWSATFGPSPPLQYPETLVPILVKVKTKTPIVLPGWNVPEVDAANQMPVSQLSMGGESQVALPNIVGLPSPRKTFGSFMSKTVSPEVKKSPLRVMRSPTGVGCARKKLVVEDLRSNDFVVITPTSKKKQVLTDHQKEVLRERSVLPTMYNNLDASQDRTLMSQFNSSMDTQTQASSQPPFSSILSNKDVHVKDEVESTDKSKPQTEKTKTPEKAKICPPSETEDAGGDRKEKKSRKSVTFMTPSKEKDVGKKSGSVSTEVAVARGSGAQTNHSMLSAGDEDNAIIIPDSETDATQNDKPLVLFGQTLLRPEENSPARNESAGPKNATKFTVDEAEMEVDVVPETECLDSPQEAQDEMLEDGQKDSDLDTSLQTQESENILTGFQKNDTRQRRSSRSSLKEKGKPLSITDEEVTQAVKKRRRGQPSLQGTKPMLQQNDEKKSLGEGFQKLDSWVVKSSKKSTSPEAPVVIVEDTQQFSPVLSKESNVNNKEKETTFCVEETPCKVSEECSVVEQNEKDKTTKTLFQTEESEQPDGGDEKAVLVAESEVHDAAKELPNSSEFVPDSQDVKQLQLEKDSLMLKPFVQLERLTKEEIERSGSSSSEDWGVTKVAQGRSRPIVKKVRRRSSIKFSKASQGKDPLAGISPVNIDDIIPSSQDSFGFGVSQEMVKDCEGSIVIVSQSERQSANQASQDESHMNMEHCLSDIITKDDKAFVVEMKPLSCSELDLKDSAQTKSSEEILVSGIPDISPVELSSDTSVNSQATIIERPRRRRSVKDLPQIKDSYTDSSQSQDHGQSELPQKKRRKASQEKSASESLSIEEESGVKTPQGSSRRPKRCRSLPKRFSNSILQLSPSRADKMTGENLKQEDDDATFNPRPEATFTGQASASSQEFEPNPEPQEQQDKAEIKEEVDKQDTVKKSRRKGRRGSAKSVNLSEVVNKKCNLDVETDSEDDIPINMLKATSIGEKSDCKLLSEDEDNLPLVRLTPRDVEPEQQDPTSSAEPAPEDHPSSHDDQRSCDIFSGSEVTSVPSETDTDKKKNSQTKKTAKTKKIYKKTNYQLKNLKINMKTSPTHRSPSSRLSLNNIKLKQRKSPLACKGHLQSKSVTPPRRRPKREGKITANSEVKGEMQEEITNKRSEKAASPQASASKDTTVSLEGKKDALSPQKQDTSMSNKIKSQLEQEESPKKGVTSPKKAVTSPSKESMPASPRRSPRKLYEESPQKSSLSPTRRSAWRRVDLPETPTSATKHQSRARLILERSKLFASRSSGSLFDKKKFTALKPSDQTDKAGMVTSGILKTPGACSSPEKGTEAVSSPPSVKVLVLACSPTFRPVRIQHICSPSASPSAGILKKRKLSGEKPVDSPSPPNKQRRVSFAETIDVCNLTVSPNKSSKQRPVNRCLDMPAKSSLVMSPLVTTSKVTTNQDKFMTTPSTTEAGCGMPKDEDAFAVPRSVRRKESEVPQTQPPSSCKSTQESQLNCEDPVFPELVSCSQPIDQILPQLTSSTWARGLGQLVRAKNIHTVGNLCALTEFDVHNLPIRSPKVSTVRRVLQDFGAQLNQRKGRTAGVDAEVAPSLDTGPVEEPVVVAKGEGSKVMESPLRGSALPRLEDEFELSPIKDLDTSVESEAENLDLALRDEPEAPAAEPSVLTSDELKSDKVTEPATPQKSETCQEYVFKDPLGSLSALDSMTPALDSMTPAPTPTESDMAEEFHTLPHGNVVEDSNKLSMADDDSIPDNCLQQTEDQTDGADDTDGKDVQVEDRTEIDSGAASKKLLSEIRLMSRRLTPEMLSEVSLNHLLSIHLELNKMVTNVIMAQRNNCPLSPSQSSQEDI